MKYLVILTLFLLMATPCWAVLVQTARGEIEISNGDIAKNNSMWTEQIKGLENVTFVGWNFSRKTPHTEVFVNCKNLTFIKCNLVNVELQEDFTVKQSLIFHRRKYSVLGKDYEEIEYKDNKTRIFEIIDKDLDERVLKSTGDTIDDKKYKVKYIDPNTSNVISVGTATIQ